MDLLNSVTRDVMHKALDGLSKRHAAISGNLANVDTPGYKRRDVSFEGALTQAIQSQTTKGKQSLHPASNDEPMSMRTSSSAHFSIGHSIANNVNDIDINIEEQDSLEYRKDGNSVDVENEMVQLARNSQRYQALTTMESRSFKSLHGVINSGGG